MGLLIALAVILGIILLAVIMIVFYKMKKRRNAIDGETTIFSRDADGGAEEIVITSHLQHSETDARQRR